MRIVTISYIGNEEDIVESFVRHHAPIAEKMIIVCTADADGTPGILSALRNEGLPLDIRLHPTDVHDQSDVLTQLLPDIDADWVLPLDADEFVQSDNLQKSLERLLRDTVTLLPWKTYVPMADDNATEKNAIVRIRYRRAEENPQFHKILIPGSLLHDKPVIAAGNHSLLRRATLEEYPAHPTSDIHLAHFPVRSAAQIRRKVTEGWRKTLAKPMRGPRENFHWKDILDGFASGRLSDEDLTAIALSYAGGHADVTLDPLRTHTRENAPTP